MRARMFVNLLAFLIIAYPKLAFMDEYNKRLYNVLTVNYSKLVRPCKNNTEVIKVEMDLKLTRIVDIDEKNQIMTTDVWITQIWYDYRFMWNPSDYNDIKVFHMPVSEIWLPDLVLYNTANGNYELSTMTKAELHWDGQVIWRIPAILRSSCTIDVRYFPFDIQSCYIKFSSWTYDLNNLRLTHIKAEKDKLFINDGIDIKYFTESDEWDIVGIMAKLSEEPEIKENHFPEIKFCLGLRRKSLFYMVNLIVPCVSMSFLTILVFLLSSNSGEKITLCISILLALTFFFLFLLDIMPPTSLVVPLLGKYLVFTITLVTLSICTTIYILNIHFRTPELNKNMPDFVRKIFLEYIGNCFYFKSFTDKNDLLAKEKKSIRLLEASMNNKRSLQAIYTKNAIITRELCSPVYSDYDTSNVILLVESDASLSNTNSLRRATKNNKLKIIPTKPKRPTIQRRSDLFGQNLRFHHLVLENIHYLNEIVDFIKRDHHIKKIRHEWKLLAYILDRILLWLFGLSFLIGTFLFFQTPLLFSEGKGERICDFGYTYDS